MADVSPPAYQASHDARDFPTCATGAFSGPRAFDFSEPYLDTNGNGQFDIGPSGAEPYCDANGNGRRDALYSSGAVASEIRTVHDPIAARAFAIADGDGHTVLIAAVTAQGLFSNYTTAVRDLVLAQVPAGTGVVVAATHNESSPDTVGIYGAPDTGQSFGATSGIDDYYMDFLVRRTADALLAAYRDLAPGRLQVAETRVPATIHQNLSTTFPTTDDAGRGVAVDPELRVLRASRPDGTGVFTVLNVADHNQEIGHGGHDHDVSDDWPGAYDRRVEQALGGTGIFLPADIGSIEDPVTVPQVGAGYGSYEQSAATGTALGDAAIAALASAQDVPYGAVASRRTVFDTPLGNNLFKAAAAAGLFATRPLYTGGQPTGRVGEDLRSEVALVDVGPEVQMLVWPGEAFPALVLGSPWGIEDASCPERANPPIPTWRSHAAYRFQIGLGGDLLGYLEPPWAWSTTPGVITDTCANNPQTNRDARGHRHKLESESVGPTSGGDAAGALAALVDESGRDPLAVIRRGRYLAADGTVTRDARQAVAVWVAPSDGATALTPGTGTVIALRGIDRFGGTPVSGHGVPMDANGRPQAADDVQTRGFAETDDAGRVLHRYYLDLYPALTTVSPGPAAGAGPSAAVPEAPVPLLLLLGGLALAGAVAVRPFAVRRRGAVAG